MVLSVSNYQDALIALGEMVPLIHSSRVHPAIKRHHDAAIQLLAPARDGEWHEIDAQKVRNELLTVRELMGDEYDRLPAPDRMIRFCDKALEALPGSGEPSQAPYE